MHIKKITFRPGEYPVIDRYPFNLSRFRETECISFNRKITFFVGDNGSGKSTLLRSLAHKTGIFIWKDYERGRLHYNRYEDQLHRYMDIEGPGDSIPGSFFASEIFHNFSEYLDEWAASDPGILEYFGGKSLIEQSHGQGHISFFRSRFSIRGLYLLDEPENALAPARQVELLRIIAESSKMHDSQFIIATHSPLILAYPDSEILSFDGARIEPVKYEETEHYRIYRDFFNDRSVYSDLFGTVFKK